MLPQLFLGGPRRASTHATVRFDPGMTLDGFEVQSMSLHRYEDEWRWRMAVARHGGEQGKFVPHYFVIARTRHGGALPVMLKIVPQPGGAFATTALPRGTPFAFAELEAAAVRALTSPELAGFATLRV